MRSNLLTIRTIALCIGLSLTISACDTDIPEIPNATKILGLWEMPGYGNAFLVEKNQTTEYEFTRNTCLKLGTETGRFGMTEKEINDANITFSVSNNRLHFSFLGKKEVFANNFKRLIKLPAHCESNLVKDTAVETFEHFWNTFNDYYAFNTERGVDWSERYAAVVDQISNDMTQEDLFTALSEMISSVDDGHISITSDTDDFSPESIRGIEKLIADTFPLQDDFSDIDDFTDALIEQYFSVLNNYFDTETKTEKNMTWGITKAGAGFLQINAMNGYTETDDADSTEEVAAVQVLLDKVMSDLKDTPSMIIDLRLNGGGTDAVSFAIANRFTDQRIKVMSKTARTFSGETAAMSAFIQPEGNAPILKPVVIIAGQDTASAAEIFLIAMGNLSPVTIIGKPSSGALSDVLSKELPNGWEFGLSNEVYLDQSGKSHEVTGVIPQTEVALFSIDDLENNRNSAIETALTILGF